MKRPDALAASAADPNDAVQAGRQPALPPGRPEQLQADLERHASLGIKVSGSEGDAATAAWIAGRLEALGFALRRQPVGVPYFEASECRLTAAGIDVPVHAQAPVQTTPDPGLTAPLAVVRAPHEAAAAAGRIALLVLPHARHASLSSPLVRPLLDAVRAAQARAVVIVPTGPSGDVVAFNAPLAGDHAGVPLAVLAPALAEPFLHAAHTHEDATLVIAGRTSRRTTHNLLGTLRRGPRWLCLSTPRTGWFTCAAERGTGTAALLALAAWAAEAFPALSLFVLNSGAHEYLFAGAEQAMALAPAPADTVAWAHLGAALAARDRLEVRGLTDTVLTSADPNRFTMATPSLHEAAVAAFAGLAGLEAVRPPLPGVSELATVVGHGHARAFAALGMHRQFHTPGDGLEVVEGRLLAPVVQAHMQVIEAALRADALASSAAP